MSRDDQLRYMQTALRALGITELKRVTRAEISFDGKSGLQVVLHMSPEPASYFDELAPLPTIAMRFVPDR